MPYKEPITSIVIPESTKEKLRRYKEEEGVSWNALFIGMMEFIEQHAI